MSLNTALVALKTANSTLNTLVGERFCPDVLPQGVTFPAVRFQELNRQRPYTWGVPLPPLCQSIVLMAAYASSPAARSTLADAIRAVFTSVTSQTAGGETVTGMMIDNEFSGGVEMLDTNVEAYVHHFHIRVHWLES